MNPTPTEPQTPDPDWQTGGDQPAPAPPTSPPADPPAPPAPPAPAAPAPDPAPAPPVEPPAPNVDVPDTATLLAQIEALRQGLADLEQRTNSGQLTLAQTDYELAQKVEQLREQFAAWPQVGGVGDAQPWDLRSHGLPQPGVTRDHLPPGQPDELSPVVIAHSKPILAPGTAGDQVAELAGHLATLGYSNSISQGRNHANAFDDTVMAAVNSFKRDFHVTEDPSQFRDAREAESVVGPWIWEAVLRAVKLAAKAL